MSLRDAPIGMIESRDNAVTPHHKFVQRTTHGWDSAKNARVYQTSWARLIRVERYLKCKD